MAIAPACIAPSCRPPDRRASGKSQPAVKHHNRRPVRRWPLVSVGDCAARPWLCIASREIREQTIHSPRTGYTPPPPVPFPAHIPVRRLSVQAIPPARSTPQKRDVPARHDDWARVSPSPAEHNGPGYRSTTDPLRTIAPGSPVPQTYLPQSAAADSLRPPESGRAPALYCCLLWCLPPCMLLEGFGKRSHHR